MNTSSPAQTPPSEALSSSPESSGPSNSPDATREKRRRSSPGTPTPPPSRRTSSQLRKSKASVSKPRAASTSALVTLRVAKSRPSLPGMSTLPTSLPAHEEEDAGRSERGASEQLRTPNRPSVKIPSPSHSAPAVTTRSSLNRQRRSTPEIVSNAMADQLLAKEIRATTIVPPSGDAKTGTNYVLDMYHKNDSRENFVKIGETRNHGDARRKQIRWNCGHVGCNVPIPGQVPSRYWKKIEKLVLTELGPHRYAINCDCGQSHREYFKPPAHLAVEATQRWTQFCESQPWDSKGKLNPFWEERLSNLQASKSLVKASWEDRAALWTEFADAGSLSFWQYNLGLFGNCMFLKYQLWMILVLNIAFNTVVGPNWYLMNWNLVGQMWLLWLYTYKDTDFAWNYARKSAKKKMEKAAKPAHRIVEVPQTPQSIREDDTEDESLESDETDEVPELGLAIRKGSRPGSSAWNPVDLTSDVEVEGTASIAVEALAS